MLDQTRLTSLFQAYIAGAQMNEESIDDLGLEELSYLYAAAEAAKKDGKYSENNLPVRQQIFYWRVVALMKEAESLFIAFETGMNYPYQDFGRNAWFFSTEEIARKAADDMKAQRKLPLMIRRVDKSMLQPMFIQLCYCGVLGVLLDQGAHPIPIKRSDLFDMPEEGPQANQRTVMNPDLQSSLIQFFQLLRAPELENRDKALPAVQTTMMVRLMNAKYLIPMQLVKDGVVIKPGIQVTETAGLEKRLGSLRDNRENTDWLPAFTDWPEFGRSFKPSEWGAAIVDYTQLMKISADAGRNIVINAGGCAFRINDQIREQLDQFAPRKEEIEKALKDKDAAKTLAEKYRREKEEKKAAEGEAAAPQTGTAGEQREVREVKDEPVTYRTPKEFPDLVASVIKKVAKSSRIVRKMWLLDRVAGKSSGYLVVVDSDQDIDQLREEMTEAAADYLDGAELEIKLLDEESEKLIEELKPFYRKGFFG